MTARRAAAVAAIVAAATSGCQGTREQLFVPVSDAGGDGAPCPWPPASGPLAEWRADGTNRNEVACSPFAAQSQGNVPYGPGRAGTAWRFRSERTVGPGDPNYLEVPGAAGHVYPALTVDAWVYQSHFNDYNGSDRTVVGTGFENFGQRAGSWLMYVHEDTSLNFFVRVTDLPASTPNVDYATCSASGPNSRSRTPIGTWVRYTATYDGMALRCFKDGVLVDMSRLPGNVTTGAGALVIGRNYPGDIDSLRIFGRALDEAEIARPWP